MTNMLDTPFDPEVEEGTPPRELIPGGRYKAEVTAANYGPTKNGRGAAVNLTWTILGGEYENRLVFQSILIEHESEMAQQIGRQRFKDLCVACNIKDKVTDLDIVLYKPCMIGVVIRKDKNGEYPDKNEVSGIMPWVEARHGNGQAEALKEASTVKPAFKKQDAPLNDDIPF